MTTQERKTSQRDKERAAKSSRGTAIVRSVISRKYHAGISGLSKDGMNYLDFSKGKMGYVLYQGFPSYLESMQTLTILFLGQGEEAMISIICNGY
jgi:hypothetical protein